MTIIGGAGTDRLNDRGCRLAIWAIGLMPSLVRADLIFGVVFI